MDNLTAAHVAAEQFAARLAIAGVSAADVAEAMVTTGLGIPGGRAPRSCRCDDGRNFRGS